MVASGGNPACASSMARPRKKDRHLPPCVYQRHGAYWYVKGGKWRRLGSELRQALEVYASLAGGREGSMAGLIGQVLEEVRPTLKESSYRQYRGAANRLKVMLAEFAPEDVEPKHVAHIKRHLAATPNAANRTLSFLRIVFDRLVEWQLVPSNPCLGVKQFKELKRDRLLSPDEYAAIYAKAPERLQVIMDLLYLTGQRVTDVLRIKRSDLTAEGVLFQQQKTGKRLCVAWSPELRAVVERAKALRGNVVALTLLHARKGKPVDYRTTKDQWDKACVAAGVKDAQLRDVRPMSITAAKAQGLDATALAGHASQKMTERYIRDRQTPLVAGPSIGQLSKTLSNTGK